MPGATNWYRPERPRNRNFFSWRNPFLTIEHLQDVRQKRIQLCKVLDSYGFNWQVWAVAASGFFTDSYNLFATNVILPALAFVYWPNATDTSRETTINLVTLSATIVGQLSFGYLADRYGRQKLYGLELILVTVSTLGLAQSSYGVLKPDGSGSSMSILGWILFWRTLMGCGIGAEYPLSAIITAEWASVRSRSKMLASVFIMQPLGQFAAYLVGLVVLLALRNNYHLDVNSDQADSAPVVDMFWRWVTGLGAVPAVVALVFRLTIPESGRWRLDVQGQADRAIIDTHAHFGTISHISLDDDLEIRSVLTQQTTMDDNDGPPPQQISFELLRRYLITDGNWRYLAGTSLSWAMFDFAYYGLQINNPRFLAKLWASSAPESTVHALPAWLPNPARWNTTTGQPTTTVYQVLIDNSIHSMISVSLGSILGSLLLICVIDYLPRRKFLIWSFLALALLTAGTGISYLHTFRTERYGITLALFILCQLLFNFGPNTLTFIIPAEIFPTHIRCTCHGIAAASGKLASVIVQATLRCMKFNGMLITNLDSNGMGWVLIIFSAALALGALFTWAWIPEVQHHRREGSFIRQSKTLEELAMGRKGEIEHEKVGMRLRMRRMKR